MIKRILLAVDDSPDSLDAARVAVDLAGHGRSDPSGAHPRSDDHQLRH
jgi:nucleotide-binding universal stress UspA family protein